MGSTTRVACDLSVRNSTKDSWYARDRLAGLRRFALAITALNVLGHLWFGFEQSPVQPVVGVLAAYSVELLLEAVGAWSERRRPTFLGGPMQWVDFLLSAHITGLAVSMLLYANERLWPIAFAAALAIASKSIFRVRIGQGTRHWLNPSNFGIATTLLLFPWIGIAPPYMFTENLGGFGDWFLPAFIICLGTLLNARFTGRLPLLGAWILAFVLQGFLRHVFFGARFLPTLMPMTGMAFLLFSFYMVTDPGTTPTRTRAQVLFGVTVAFLYGALMVLHVVFGLFFALVLTCLGRGSYLYFQQWRAGVAQATVVSERTAPLRSYTLQPAAYQAPLAEAVPTQEEE